MKNFSFVNVKPTRLLQALVNVIRKLCHDHERTGGLCTVEVEVVVVGVIKYNLLRTKESSAKSAAKVVKKM
jgi:hypothetical protein